jgi:Tic22-like family
MKSLVRLGLALSLLGGTVVGQNLIQPAPAVALSEANKDGVPILASIANPKDKTKQVQIATFFMNPQDAQTLVTTLKTQKPDVGNSARVVSLSMRQAYDIKSKNKDKAESLVFEFLPSKQQVDAAVAVLKQNGQDVKQFNDIALFYSKAKIKSSRFTSTNKTYKGCWIN